MKNKPDQKQYLKSLKSVLLLVLIITASLSLWTCATPYQQLLDEPQVEYQGMEMTGKSAYEVTPVFKFRVTNTNPSGMSVKDVDYKLEINKEKFVKGVSGKQLRVRPLETVIVELPVPFDFRDLFYSTAQLQDMPVVNYDLFGTMEIGPFSVPYHVDGEFEVPRSEGS